MERISIRIWLWVGVFMIFFQIVLGGITRLTGSGLSITRWDIVTGTLPPLNQTEWQEAFDLYKATPQYQKINEGMTLSAFKFIFFWEFIHRLWARSIGVVFLIPFLFFLSRGWLSRKLIGRLAIAVLLGAIVATFGWIMVASGLEERPWVNAYNLTVHLNLGLLLYAWMFWVALGERRESMTMTGLNPLLKWFTGLLIFQLVLGGMMSGMKAGVYYPTWPDMYGEFFPTALLDANLWNAHLLFDAYEQGPVPGVVQFLHRMTAYALFGLSVIIFCKSVLYKKIKGINGMMIVFLSVVLLQVTLGILTVVHSVGKIPLGYGVAHQAIAILLLSDVIYLRWKIRS